MMDLDNYGTHPRLPGLRAPLFTTQWRKMISHGDDMRGGGWFNDMGNVRMNQFMKSCINQQCLLEQLKTLKLSEESLAWIDTMGVTNAEHTADFMEGP